MNKLAFLGITSGLLALLNITMSSIVHAAVASSYSPPATIAVSMYRLDASGASTEFPCAPGSDAWGCTAYCRNLVGPGLPCNTTKSNTYPFWSGTASVTIEGTGCLASPSYPGYSPFYDCYLRDVMPQETSPTLFHPTAVGAQAIAARTYAYWHIKTDDVTPGSINNSSAYQVFVPYRYDTFAQGERDIVDAALQGRYYLSNISAYTVNLYGQNVNLTADDPIFAEFFADRPLETLRACLGSLIVLSLISDLITGYCPQHSTHS